MKPSLIVANAEHWPGMTGQRAVAGATTRHDDDVPVWDVAVPIGGACCHAVAEVTVSGHGELTLRNRVEPRRWYSYRKAAGHDDGARLVSPVRR